MLKNLRRTGKHEQNQSAGTWGTKGQDAPGQNMTKPLPFQTFRFPKISRIAPCLVCLLALELAAPRGREESAEWSPAWPYAEAGMLAFGKWGWGREAAESAVSASRISVSSQNSALAMPASALRLQLRLVGGGGGGMLPSGREYRATTVTFSCASQNVSGSHRAGLLESACPLHLKGLVFGEF